MYLLNFIEKNRHIGPENDYLDAELEHITSKLKIKSNELLAVKAISLDLEDKIYELKKENTNLFENNHRINLELSKRSKKPNEESKYNAIKKDYLKLVEKNKTLMYALRLERSQCERISTALDKSLAAPSKNLHSENLLNKTIDYLLKGPIGSEYTLLEKQVERLQKELEDQEKYYKLKIDKLYVENKKLLEAKDSISKFDHDHLLDENKKLKSRYEELTSLNEKISLNLEERKSLTKKEVSESDSTKKIISEYQTHIKELNEKLKVKLNSKAQFDERVLELETRLKRSLEDNADLKDMLSQKDQELLKSRDHSSHLKKRLDIISLENEELKTNKVSDNQSLLLSNLREDNKKLFDKFNLLKDRSLKYKVAYNELSEKHKKIKTEMKNQNEKFNNMLSKSNAIIDSLKSKVDGVNNNYTSKIKELEEVKVREKTLLHKIEDFKKSQQDDLKVVEPQDKEDEEKNEVLSRLIGDSFEVSNDSSWMILNELRLTSGPYSFSEIYQMKISGELDGDIKIKNGEEPFKVKNDIFELSVPVKIYDKEGDTRYFISRSSMRVPFYELITFEINGVEHRGYCTSLSLGGVFLEVTKLSEDFTIDKKGRVLFSSGILDNSFQCVAQIKNISDSRPKGIGLMFIDLPEQAKEDISFYINNYLNRTKQVA